LCLEEVLESFVAARLLVRNEGESDRVLRADALVEKRFGCEKGGNEVLLVVLSAPAEYLAVLDVALVRVVVPEVEIAGRDDVEVGKYPDRSLPVISGDDGD